MPSTPWTTMLRRARAGLHHAFDIREQDLSAEEKAVLDQAAELVVNKKLGGPASFLLESSRPLNFVTSQMLAFLEPFLAGPLGVKRFAALRGALEKRASIDYFLDAIERLEPGCESSEDPKAPRP